MPISELDQRFDITFPLAQQQGKRGPKRTQDVGLYAQSKAEQVLSKKMGSDARRSDYSFANTTIQN